MRLFTAVRISLHYLIPDTMKRYLLLLTVIITVLLSCKKDKANHSPDGLRGISLTQDTLTMYTGQTMPFSFSVRPADFDRSSLNWSSSDTSVLTVTNTGKAIAKNTGRVTVTVTNAYKSVTAKCLVLIVPIDGIRSGLIAYYPFNGNAADLSGRGLDGTIVNNVTPTQNRFGTANSAYHFDGVNSYIKVNDKNTLRLAGTDFTINSWVKVEKYSTSYGSIIIGKRGNKSHDGYIFSVGGGLNIADPIRVIGSATFNLSGADNPYAFSRIKLQLNQWRMVTVVYDYTKKQMLMYVNGVLDTVTDHIPSPNTTTNVDLFIGADSQGTFNTSYTKYFFNGDIDDIRIFRRALRPQDVHDLFVAAD